MSQEKVPNEKMGLGKVRIVYLVNVNRGKVIELEIAYTKERELVKNIVKLIFNTAVRGIVPAIAKALIKP